MMLFNAREHTVNGFRHHVTPGTKLDGLFIYFREKKRISFCTKLVELQSLTQSSGGSNGGVPVGQVGA
jgi:hypothetical protein